MEEHIRPRHGTDPAEHVRMEGEDAPDVEAHRHGTAPEEHMRPRHGTAPEEQVRPRHGT